MKIFDPQGRAFRAANSQAALPSEPSVLGRITVRRLIEVTAIIERLTGDAHWLSSHDATGAGAVFAAVRWDATARWPAPAAEATTSNA
jgi:hypothetical protein